MESFSPLTIAACHLAGQVRFRVVPATQYSRPALTPLISPARRRPAERYGLPLPQPLTGEMGNPSADQSTRIHQACTIERFKEADQVMRVGPVATSVGCARCGSTLDRIVVQRRRLCRGGAGTSPALKSSCSPNAGLLRMAVSLRALASEPSGRSPAGVADSSRPESTQPRRVWIAATAPRTSTA